MPQNEPLGDVRRERPSFDRRPCARGQFEQEVEIMQAEQAEAKHLLLIDQVPDVGA